MTESVGYVPEFCLPPSLLGTFPGKVYGVGIVRGGGVCQYSPKFTWTQCENFLQNILRFVVKTVVLKFVEYAFGYETVFRDKIWRKFSVCV